MILRYKLWLFRMVWLFRKLCEIVLLGAVCCGCIDSPLLPDFIRLPFEGSGMSAQKIAENKAEMTEWRTEGRIIIEVEGFCDGYSTGSAWISAYEREVASWKEPLQYTLLGCGHGLDGMASTDSRPCLRYEIAARDIEDFMLAVIEAAIDTGMWKVYFNRQTGLIDGNPEFDCIEFWEVE